MKRNLIETLMEIFWLSTVEQRYKKIERLTVCENF